MATIADRTAVPVIERLREAWGDVQRQEAHRLLNRLPQLNEGERAEVACAFERLVDALLHPPTESLRRQAECGAAEPLFDATTRLFRLSK